MNIVKPDVELWDQTDPIAHVARCARVCYKSSKTTDNKKLVHNLRIKGHNSMFRHETVYSMIPYKDYKDLWSNVFGAYLQSPYIDWISDTDFFYVSTNGNFLMDIAKENPVMFNWIVENRVSNEEFLSTELCWKYLARYTFHVTTQISTSRELNRVSPNNIAEQSTRYVKEEGTICEPWWYKDGSESNKVLYLESCRNSFNAYNNLIKGGMLRQDARGALPLDTATECVYTYNIHEWRHIIDLRYYGTTGKPHPNCVIIAKLIKEQLEDQGYDFR